MTPDLIEKMARAICELRIREVRRFDRTPEEIEQKISASVDFAWRGWVPEATAALAVALDAIGGECAKRAASLGSASLTPPRLTVGIDGTVNRSTINSFDGFLTGITDT